MDDNWAFVFETPMIAGCILTVALLALCYLPLAIILLVIMLPILKMLPQADRKYKILGFLNATAFTVFCIIFMLRVHLPPDLDPTLFYLMPSVLGYIYGLTIVFPIGLAGLLRELIMEKFSNEN